MTQQPPGGSCDTPGDILRSLLALPGLAAPQRHALELIRSDLTAARSRLGIADSPSPETVADYDLAAAQAMMKARDLVVGAPSSEVWKPPTSTGAEPTGHIEPRRRVCPS